MDMPVDTSLVGYADDVAAIIASRDLEGAQMKLNQVMRRVSQWMVDHGLSLAVQKTEIVVLTTRRMDTIVPIQVGNETIQTKAAVRHLGIMLDTKLIYWEQIRRAMEKADTATTNLSRLMANVDGPKPSKRRVLISVVHSILLYGRNLGGCT